MARVELSWNTDNRNAADGRREQESLRLSDDIMRHSIRLFVVVRWIAVGVFLCFHFLSSFAPRMLDMAGMIPATGWPLPVAVILALANSAFMLSSRIAPRMALWAQIIVDLLCLAVVVHFLGSIGTPAPFIYVLHIVLACIFFSFRSSLIVTWLAVVSYAACVGLEGVGVLHPVSVLKANQDALTAAYSPGNFFWHLGATTVFLFCVWYLVSRLALVIRVHEHELIKAEERTRASQVEKDRYALQMTHQLKAPLDAIRMTLSIIITGRFGMVPADIIAPLKRIDQRAANMAGLVKDVMRLSRLKAEMVETAERRPVDLGKLLDAKIEDYRPILARKALTVEMTVKGITVRCNPDQIEILLDNLLTNAIGYSHAQSAVKVQCGPDAATGQAFITVADSGIGISAEQLPHIFDEYYRTPEAVRHNEASSGVGLAIVKRVAQNHGLALTVESEPGKGTSFTVTFPESALFHSAPGEIDPGPFKRSGSMAKTPEGFKEGTTTLGDVIDRAVEYEKMIERFCADLRDRTTTDSVRLLTYFLARQKRSALQTLNALPADTVAAARAILLPAKDAIFLPERCFEGIYLPDNASVKELIDVAVELIDTLVCLYSWLAERQQGDGEVQSVLDELRRRKEAELTAVRRLRDEKKF